MISAHPPDAMPLLVGREREAALLRTHLTAALAGRGSLVLIGGEAGVGKTALAEMICREAANQGARVLVGHCFDLAETPAYGPWIDLFAHYPAESSLPPLPRAFAHRGTVGAVPSQMMLFVQVEDFLTALALHQPVVVLLEDVYWADPASLDVLGYLARSVAALPLLMLATYRSEELAPDSPLSLVLPRLTGHAGAERLDLRPLDDDAVRALVSGRYRLPDTDTRRLTAYVQARAKGNALFVGELLRSLGETGALRRGDGGWHLGDLARTAVPAFLRQVINGRLARLDGEAQQLLAIAAVIGDEASLDTWAAVSGIDEETLTEIVGQAIAAHLMDESPDGTHARFVHALIREALYEDLRPSQRRRWHRTIGEVLATQPTADPDAVASHFLRANDERAADWLVRAGERAERSYALVSAIERFRAAAAMLAGREGQENKRGWLLVRVGWLCRGSDDEGGFVALAEAKRLAHEADDALLTACAIFFYGQLLCFQQRFREGLAELDRGMAAFAALPPEDRARLRTLPTLGDHLDDHGRFGEPACWRAFIGWFREARAIGERVVGEGWEDTPLTGRENICDHYAYRGLSIVSAALGETERARAAFARALAIPRALSDHLQLCITAADELERLVLPYYADRLEERRRIVTEITASWARGRMDARRHNYPDGFHLVALAVVEGRWDAVREAGRAAQAARSGTGWLFPRRALAEVGRYQGDAAMVRDLVADLLPDGPATAPGETRFLDATAMQRAAAGLALDCGEFHAARRWLEAHDRWLEWAGVVRWRSEGHTLWGEYSRAIGDSVAAHRHAATALATATEPRQPLALIAAHRLLGELDTDSRRFADAERHLDAALALAGACAAPYERALTLLALAELRAAKGESAEAQRLLDDARAIFLPLNAAPALARAAALATRLAPAPPPPRYPDGLSVREVDVLRLIASGGTNQEIAATLFLSVRTIERHITSAYRKINARGRADATAYAVRHALLPDHSRAS